MSFFEVKPFKFIIFATFCFNTCKILDVIIAGFRANGPFIVTYFTFGVIENVLPTTEKSNKNALSIKPLFKQLFLNACKMLVDNYHASISVLEVICLPDIVTGLSVFTGGVLSIRTGGDDCMVVLFA